jgi:hypothetical protein
MERDRQGRRPKMRGGVAVVRPLAWTRGRGEWEGARAVCSERRKERMGERDVVAGHFSRCGGGEREKGGLVWDVPHGRRS